MKEYEFIELDPDPEVGWFVHWVVESKDALAMFDEEGYITIVAGEGHVVELLRNVDSVEMGRLGRTNGKGLLKVLRRLVRKASEMGMEYLHVLPATDELEEKYLRIAKHIGGRPIWMMDGILEEIEIPVKKAVRQ